MEETQEEVLSLEREGQNWRQLEGESGVFKSVQLKLYSSDES